MKRVLVTAGTVYGRLDDNKLVGNRIRGIWATKFAVWLASKTYDVTLLVPDTMDTTALWATGGPFYDNGDGPDPLNGGKITVLTHNGYDSYAAQCYELAPKMNAAVMAAAVVNWIPQTPFKGKMPTEGHREGDVQHIPFILAPRVIDRMKKINPGLALIGCKMTSGATADELNKAAYSSLIKAHANVVVANDLSKLKQKLLIFPDGAKNYVTDFDEMYSTLQEVIDDEHYRTVEDLGSPVNIEYGNKAAVRMDRIIAKYRDGFSLRADGVERVFGGIAVRAGPYFLVSPREKGRMWTANEAVLVTKVQDRVIHTIRGRKASLNAPVLIAHLERWKSDGSAVLHQHYDRPYEPTERYAPPGTVRDNERIIPARTFNIELHGFVALLDDKNEIIT